VSVRGLIAELERRLSDRGCVVLIADVWRDAERFYRSHGWTPPDVVLLRKRLDAPAAQPAVAYGREPSHTLGLTPLNGTLDGIRGGPENE
jgi:hypothetical protein